MGVRGLSSFMYDHGVFEDINLTNKGRLIIDGNNLRFFLMDKKINTYYGMDYDKYGKVIKDWFTHLISNGNSLILIFDGVGEAKKDKTAVARKKDQIRSSVTVSPNDNRGHISVLSKDVFVSIAKSFPPSEILVIQTHYECDNVMANLAKKLNAPVLTNDSDFYIFNVEFLPLHSLDFDSLRVSRFDKEAFMKKFKLTGESTIYLMASLLGNDYIPRSMLDQFYSQIHFPFKSKKMSPSAKRIFALLLWLGRSNSNSEALEIILKTFPMNRRDKLKALIEESIKVYNGENICSSIQSLDKPEDILKYVLDVDQKLVDPEGNAPSNHFLELFHSLEVDAWLGNVFVNRTLTVPIPVEVKTEETGLLMCLPIYKKIAEFMTITEEAVIKCFIRNKSSLQIMPLTIDHPQHQNLTLDKESKLRILLEVINLPYTQYESMSRSFDGVYHILFLALHYFSSKRSGSSLYIKTLCVLLLLKSPSVAGETLEALSENFTNRMKSFFTDVFKTSNASTSAYNRFIVHEFNLIQWSIHAISNLNTLLGSPLPSMLPAMDFWNGTFLYNFATDILHYMDRDARYNSLLKIRGAKSDDDSDRIIGAMERMTGSLQACLPHFKPVMGISTSGKKPRNRNNRKK